MADRRLAGRELGEDLSLAAREVLERRARPARPGGHELVDDLRIDDRTAAGHGVDRVDDLVDIGNSVLQQIRTAVGTVLEQRMRVRRRRVLRQHDDAHVRVVLTTMGGGPDPFIGVGRRHPDVGQDHIGRIGVDHLDQLSQRADRGNDAQVVRLFEQPHQPLS